MSGLAPPRRGFLRDLVSLPLIGGGVTLLGRPTAAAVPVTEALLESYDSWLFHERQRLRLERFGSALDVHQPPRDGDLLTGTIASDLLAGTIAGSFKHAMVDVVRFNAGVTFHSGGALPSERAAVVLSAVGCDWGPA